MFVIKKVSAQIPFAIESVNISEPENAEWLTVYRNDIPVVHLNGKEIFRHRVEERRLRKILAESG